MFVVPKLLRILSGERKKKELGWLIERGPVRMSGGGNLCLGVCASFAARLARGRANE